jgi:hypothetical protein
MNAGVLTAAARDRDGERVWEIAIGMGDDALTRPNVIWDDVASALRFADDDGITAIATCILEHVLENSFDDYIGRVEAEIASGNRNMLEALKRSWKFEQAKTNENSARWDGIIERCEQASP